MKVHRLDNEAFGEVRSIVHGPAGAEAFERLTAVLDTLTEEGARMFPHGYLDPVRAWSALARVAPESWLEDLRAERRPAFWELCASLTLTPDLQDLLDHPALENIQALRLPMNRYGEPTDALYERLCEPTALGELTEIALPSFQRESTRAFLERCQELRRIHITTPIRVNLSTAAGEAVPGDEITTEWLLDHLGRGKVEALTLTLSGSLGGTSFLEGVASGVRLRELHVEDLPSWARVRQGDLSKLLEMPLLSELEALSINAKQKVFRGRLKDELLDELLLSPSAGTLKHLSLRGHQLTEAGVATLSALPKLRALDVRDNDPSPGNLRQTAAARPARLKVDAAGSAPEAERAVLRQAEHLEDDWRRYSRDTVVHVEYLALWVAVTFIVQFIWSLTDATPGIHMPFWSPALIPLLYGLHHQGIRTTLDVVDLRAMRSSGTYPGHEIRQAARLVARRAWRTGGLYLGATAASLAAFAYGGWSTGGARALGEGLFLIFGPGVTLVGLIGLMVVALVVVGLIGAATYRLRGWLRPV